MNKGQIRSQFLALLNRNDCSNELADTFLEQGLARIQRTLRVPAMEKVETYTVNDVVPNTLILPNDFLNIKHLYSGDILLEYVDLNRYLQYNNSVDSPRVYTRIQGELKIKPTPPEGTEILMVYIGEIPDLTTDTSTNFITEIAPELLVYGGLTYAADYFIDERKPLFEETFGRVFSELTEQAYLTEFEQSAMRMGSPFVGVEY
jgi:hypothetical protein